MRTTILFLGLFFTSIHFSNAQVLDALNVAGKIAGEATPDRVVIESAPSLEKKLDNLEDKFANLDEKLEKIESYSKNMEKLQQDEEDALWRVPDYVKYGNTVNSIFQAEKDAYKSANNLYRLVTSKRNYKNPKSIVNMINRVLKTIDLLATDANDLRSDDTYRLPLAERESRLKNILSQIQSYNSMLESELSKATTSDEIYDSYLEREARIRGQKQISIFGNN